MLSRCCQLEGSLSPVLDRIVRVWDIEPGKGTCGARELTRLEIDAEVLCLAALPTGHLVAGDALGRLHWLEFLE